MKTLRAECGEAKWEYGHVAWWSMAEAWSCMGAWQVMVGTVQSGGAGWKWWIQIAVGYGGEQGSLVDLGGEGWRHVFVL